MNLYVVVEGKRTEPTLLRAWLPKLLDGAHEVERIEDATDKSFYLVAGGGYPSIFIRLNAASKDIAASPGQFQHLLVILDAEDEAVDARRAEVNQVILKSACPVPSTVVVANCCVESWLLGNQKMMPKRAEPTELRRLQDWYDVRALDPEHMLKYPDCRNRAATHLKYLRAMFRARTCTYNKNNPGEAATPDFLAQLEERAGPERFSPPHLRSMRPLLDLASTLGW